MRIGAIVLQALPWSELAPVFRRIEEIGCDVAYVADHLTHPTMVGEWLGEAFATLAAAATVTDGVELGTLVASAAFRSPVTLSRSAATVQDVSGGRLVLGLGSGSPHCAAADRGAHPTPRELVDRFADVVEGLGRVWADDESWHGKVLSYDGSQVSPLAPGSTPPFLLLAAHGPRTFDLVARHADGWSTYGGAPATQLPPDEFWQAVALQSGAVTEACERVGRTEPLRRSLLLGYGTIRPLESAETFRECLDRAEEHGFDEVVVYWPYGEAGGRFAGDPDVLASLAG